MSDKFYAGQVNYIPQLNALWDRATTSVFGTSTDSLSISVASKSFTTNTYLQFAVGSQVTITATTDLSKYMSGQVTAYNQATGAITVNITSVMGSGTFSNWSIALSGAAGATGADGIADNISIGTVTSGTAAASITGTSPNKFLNLTLQTGATGATGAAGAPNVLSIGTVTSGGAADATITGTSPSQVLNLVLPKGDTGATGATGAKGVNPRGTWGAGVAYLVDDLAYYAGSTWRRIIAGTTATAPSSDATNWEIFAQKGADGAGSVAGVTASAPLASSGGANPDISITQANTSTSGYLSSTDWNTFNGKAGLVSPSFTTPSLGVATATTINKVTFTAPATGSTITIADGKTFTSSNTLTITGTDGSTLNVGTGGTLGTAAYTSSTAYAPTAGSASVTTLGTVTTGTWNAGIVVGQYGGTGVNNSGKTITLGGNLTTSGAFASTFTMAGITSVTFPTSGTLLSTAATVTVAQGGTGLTTLTAGSVLVGAGTSSPTLVAPSTAGNVLTSDGTTWISSPATGGGGSITIEDRTSNAQLLLADKGKFINVTSGTFTQTFDTTNFTSGWYVYYKNEGIGEVTIPSSDGVSNWKMYPNELRLFIYDGTNLRSEVINAFNVTFTSSGTFVKPPCYSSFGGLLWGAGGAGASARFNPATNSNYGLSGGGAGACHPFIVASTNLTATVAYTIGAGGTGTAAPSVSLDNGNAGGNSTFAGFTGYGGAGGVLGSVYGGAGVLSVGHSGGKGGSPTGGFYQPNVLPSTADLVSSYVGGGYGGQYVTFDTGNSNYTQAFSGGSYYGGAGGTGCYGNGSNYTTVTAASNSVYGGTAGQPIILGASSTFLNPAKGTSTYGGTGGDASRGTGARTGTAGGVRGGGGGAAWSTDNVSATGGAGGRGEMQIWGVI